MGNSCTELPGSAVETFVLAIDLVGYELKHGPEQVLRALESPAVRKAIEAALEKRAGTLQKQVLTGSPLDAQQGLAEIKSVFTGEVFDAATPEIKKSLEQTQAYRHVMSSVQNLKCKFEESPIGFFIDEPESILLIVTTGVLLGGAAAIYVAATGDKDTLAGLAGKIASKALHVEVLGKIDLGIKDVVLKPSTSQYDAKLFANTSSWKAVPKTEFSVTVRTKDEKVAAIDIGVETEKAIAKGWTGNVAAGYDLTAKKYRFSLGIKGEDQGFTVQVKANYVSDPTTTSYGASGDLGYKIPGNSGVQVTAGGSWTRTTTDLAPDALRNLPSRTSTSDNVQVNLGLKFSFR